MPIIRNTGSRSTKKQQGFNMVEILVTVFISAFALLGLAGLQISSVNTTNVSYTKSQSMMVITEIIDQMRSNVDAAKNGDFDIDATSGGNLKSFADMGNAPGTGATQIEKIKYYWFENIDRTLPGAKAGVSCSSTGMCALKLQYSNVDKDKTGSETVMEQIITVQL